MAPGQAIPNLRHPSDHFPVKVVFGWRTDHERRQGYARAWTECVAGDQRTFPLSKRELQEAFEFFDQDCGGAMDFRELEEGLL